MPSSEVFIKSFIGRFPEISDRSRQEQAALLEQARYEIFVSQRRTGRVALYLVISLLVGFVVTIGGRMLFVETQPMWAFAFLGLGIVAAGLTFRKLHTGLVREGLQEVLQREGPARRKH